MPRYLASSAALPRMLTNRNRWYARDKRSALRYRDTGQLGATVMTDRVWYYAVGGNRQGPVPDAELHGKIASGEIRADTLVWSAGMTDWTKAGEIPGLISAGVVPLDVPLTPAFGPMPLKPVFGIWELLGWGLLALIGQLLVIPSPWTTTAFYRWLISRIEVPNGRSVHFDGDALDIWYVIIANAALAYVGLVYTPLGWLQLPLGALFNLLILRWLVSKLRWEGQGDTLRFDGSYWALLGWSVLSLLSIITIIGWAWVVTASMRWICRHVEGSSQQLSFVGSGWGFLWRTLVYAISAVFIIPIPWTFAWLMRWMVSQFHLGARA